MKDQVVFDLRGGLQKMAVKASCADMWLVTGGGRSLLCFVAILLTVEKG